ncbi:MAG: site-specific DNA-methyltransferase [Proteobacteria bacterium]|nr:site-specific DNA-methyltransferase [Pseudomonadota bacterium]
MNLIFDPAQALESSAFHGRVQSSEDQHRLDIVAKERTSALPWRGQFSPQLVEYLLSRHSEAGKTIVDPFCGSGTVLHEAARSGAHAHGFDVNPAAICLAKVSELSNLDMAARWALIDSLRAFSHRLGSLTPSHGMISCADAVAAIDASRDDPVTRTALEGFLLFAFTNGTAISPPNLRRATERYLSVLADLRQTNCTIMAQVGDARSIPADPATFDYMITSPPYINVFNYHQNYRPIIEALGHSPLAAAKSEIGANRKFRQNRYMTVVQYCMDMAWFFVEARRILKDSAKLTIVLGRESNVRSVSYRNGELISAIACEGIGFKLIDWHERKFTNRFGEAIFEDVLTVVPATATLEHALGIGRAVGRQALENSLEYCPIDRRAEIEAAIESANSIEPSQISGAI